MLDDQSLAVWSCARTSSTRCPNKMLRPFQSTTLTDILLSKLAALPTKTFFAGYEGIFKERCAEHNVPFVQRSRESAENHDTSRIIHSFLTEQPYDYLLHVNGCLPFLRPDTIMKFLKTCFEENPIRPCFAVIRKNNHFVNLDGTPLNFPGDLSTINTRTVQPVYEFAHALYFFRRADFVKNGFFWDWQEVRYIEVEGGVELFDIDTEDEFQTASLLWKEVGDSVVKLDVSDEV